MRKTTRTGCKKTKAKAKRKRRRAALPVSAVRVRAAALAHDTIAAAAAALDIDPPLEDCLSRYPVLQAAWERGQFLRRFAAGVRSGATVSQLARKFDMEPTALRDEIARDHVLRDLWDETTFQLDMAIKAGFIEAVKNGDLSATAVGRVERLLRDHLGDEVQPTAAPAGERISQKELTKLLGVSRQALHTWQRSNGLPRNVDGSYDLRDVLAWYRRYIEEKTLTLGPRRALPGGIPRKEELKNQIIELDLAERKGQLWRREQVVDHWIGQAQVVANTLSEQVARDLGHRLAGHTAEEVTLQLGKVFRKVRRTLAELPARVKLPDRAAALYGQLIEALAPDGAKPENGTT